MSRRKIFEWRDRSVIVGWDPINGTFFLQVMNSVSIGETYGYEHRNWDKFSKIAQLILNETFVIGTVSIEDWKDELFNDKSTNSEEVYDMEAYTEEEFDNDMKELLKPGVEEHFGTLLREAKARWLKSTIRNIAPSQRIASGVPSKVLTLRLATIETVITDTTSEYVLRPYTAPSHIWHPDIKQEFTCKYGHKQINEECGCGILTTLDTKEVHRHWNSCMKKDDPYYLWTVVQNYGGSIIYDPETRDVLSPGVFLWGYIVPKWATSANDISSVYRNVIQARKYPNDSVHPAVWSNPGECFDDILETTDYLRRS